MLVMPISGCLDASDDDEPDDPYKNYVNFYSVDLNGVKAWAIQLYVEAEPENGTEWFWDDAKVVLRGPKGADPTTLVPTLGDAGPGSGTRAYYTLDTSTPNRTAPYNITWGDALVVTGVTDEYLNGDITIEIGDDVIRFMNIPKELGEDVEMSLEGDPPSPNLWNDSISWNLVLRPNVTRPSTFPVFWDTLRAGIIGPDGDYLVDLRPLSKNNKSELYKGLEEDMDVNFRFYDYNWRDEISDVYQIHTPQYYWHINCLADEGDEVVVLGLTRAHVGGKVVIHKGIDRIAESLPIGALDDPVLDVTLGTPVIENKVTNDSMFHNAYVEVEELELSNDSLTILWSVARVMVTDKEGVVLGNMSVHRNVQNDFCSSFEASADEYIDEGDELLLKGLDLSFRGANLELFISRLSVANVTFPDEFNITGIEVSTTFLDPDERMVEGEVLYDLKVAATSEKPFQKTIPWDNIVARVVDRASGTTLIDNTTPGIYSTPLPEEPTILMRVREDENMTEQWKATFYIPALSRTFEWSYLELFIGDDMVGYEQLDGPFNSSVSNATMNLASPNIRSVDINSTTFYEAILNINKITPIDAKLHWASFTMRILSEEGSTLVPVTSLMPHTGITDTDDSDGIDIELWYVETATGDTKASAGDAFWISGLTNDFEGAIVQVMYQGEVIGRTTLPSDFA